MTKTLRYVDEILSDGQDAHRELQSIDNPYDLSTVQVDYGHVSSSQWQGESPYDLSHGGRGDA
jgi:hypothetical protein